MKIRTVINYAKKRMQQEYWHLRTGYKYIPYIATVELTSRCNAHCVYCGRENLPFIGDMSIEDYKRVIDAMPFVKVIAPWAVGESLMHKDVIEAVAYAKKKKKFVNISTNGHYLNTAMSEGLLRAGLDELKLSVDTNNPNEYEATRPPLKWDTLIGNIYMFKDLRDAGGYKTKICMRMTSTKENRDKVEEIINFWGKIVDDALYRNARDFFPGEHANASSKRGPIKCRRISDEIVIRANGNVVLCCDDWFDENLIGKIDFATVTQKDILDIFNSDKMNAMRKAIITGKNYPFLCDVCVPQVNERSH